ncbi:MAG: cytochrome P460 family protein [Sphingomonadales bacterium]|jgi:hypothetical protein
MKKTIKFGLLGLGGVIAIAASAYAMGPSAPEWEKALYVPENDYRTEWVTLGSFSVLADKPEEGAKELHVVYTDAKNVKAYKETGIFPDGAVIVKDVFATATEDLPTGRASYGSKLAGRFVMVKDGTNKYADKSDLYGDGWGWAFYEGDETTHTVTTDYTVDCMGCHIPAQNTDYLFVQGYPVLK